MGHPRSQGYTKVEKLVTPLHDQRVRIQNHDAIELRERPCRNLRHTFLQASVEKPIPKVISWYVYLKVYTK